MRFTVRAMGALALGAVLMAAVPTAAMAAAPALLPGPAPSGTASAAPAKPPLKGELVLRPGRIEVHMGDQIWAIIPSPEPLDLVDLVELVADQKLVSRLPDGRVELWVPIEQRAGSRLSVSGDTVPELRLMAGSTLSGSDALLSLHGADLTASGDAGSGAAEPLIDYDQDSGVRMSRLTIDDSRTGRGAGPVVAVTGRSALSMMTAVVTGGHGGLQLDDATPVDLTGVQIAHTHGTGLTAVGSTDLTVASLTVRSNAADGVSLSGADLTWQATGPITAAGNRGEAVRLTGTSNLNPSSVQVSSGRRLTPADLSPAQPARSGPTGGVPLSWLVAAGLLLIAAAAALEVVRQRRDPDTVVTAPEHVLNRR